MQTNRYLPLLTAVILTAVKAQAQFTISPLVGFGGADGWLAPGEGGYTFLGTGNLERGIAYGNNNLYLVSRNGGSFVRVLDPLTAADSGTPLNVSGVSGGTFALNQIAVGGDGAIYAANLTTQSTTTPSKVYRWVTVGSTPTLAYTGDGGLAGSRLGDSLAVIGSGSSTLLALGYGSTPAVAGNNGYAIVDPTAGTATRVAFAGTPPAAGDFRLGITFSDSTHVLGSQGSSLYRYTSFAGTTGTLLGSPALGSVAERLLAYTVLNGQALLAVQSTGDSHVSIYDATNPGSPVLLMSGNNTSGVLAANGNATGELAWGAVTDLGNGVFSKKLYAMSSNQGIQAFIVSVPETGTLGLAALGLGALVLVRRFRK